MTVSGTKSLNNVCRINLAEIMPMALSITKDFYYIWMRGWEGEQLYKEVE